MLYLKLPKYIQAVSVTFLFGVSHVCENKIECLNVESLSLKSVTKQNDKTYYHSQKKKKTNYYYYC